MYRFLYKKIILEVWEDKVIQKKTCLNKERAENMIILVGGRHLDIPECWQHQVGPVESSLAPPGQVEEEEVHQVGVGCWGNVGVRLVEQKSGHHGVQEGRGGVGGGGGLHPVITQFLILLLLHPAATSASQGWMKFILCAQIFPTK